MVTCLETISLSCFKVCNTSFNILLLGVNKQDRAHSFNQLILSSTTSAPLFKVSKFTAFIAVYEEHTKPALCAIKPFLAVRFLK